MKAQKNKYIISVAAEKHLQYSATIVQEMETSALIRGTGIAKRTPEFIEKKMLEGKAVIALTSSGEWAGFCYIESWSHGKFVANSGLIVKAEFRKTGLAKEIKERIFQLSRTKYPQSKIFGLTTGLAVMKINSDLGYEPVTYQELTTDEEFWNGCKSCVNHSILMAKERSNCLCTAMLYNPEESIAKKWKGRRLDFSLHSELYERYMRLKKSRLLRRFSKPSIPINQI